MIMTKPHVALTVLALTLSVVPAYAQPLTQQERDSLLKHLQQTRQAFLDSIFGAVGGAMDVQGRSGPVVDRGGCRTHRDQRNDHPSDRDGPNHEGSGGSAEPQLGL